MEFEATFHFLISQNKPLQTGAQFGTRNTKEFKIVHFPLHHLLPDYINYQNHILQFHNVIMIRKPKLQLITSCLCLSPVICCDHLLLSITNYQAVTKCPYVPIVSRKPMTSFKKINQMASFERQEDQPTKMTSFSTHFIPDYLMIY